MSDNIKFKTWLWEMTPQGEDNKKHFELNSKVDLVSVPIEVNDLPNNVDEKYPPILDTLKQKLEFKGNIRLSGSGKSYSLYRDALDDSVDNSLVTLSIPSPI